MRNFEAQIIIKDGMQPVFAKAWPIPIAMKDKVAKELEKSYPSLHVGNPVFVKTTRGKQLAWE